MPFWIGCAIFIIGFGFGLCYRDDFSGEKKKPWEDKDE